MNAEKEKLLNEIIEWTEQYWKVALESGNLSRFEHSESGMRWNDGRMAACDDFVAHCKHMMGQNWGHTTGCSHESKRGHEMSIEDTK